MKISKIGKKLFGVIFMIMTSIISNYALADECPVTAPATVIRFKYLKPPNSVPNGTLLSSWTRLSTTSWFQCEPKYESRYYGLSFYADIPATTFRVSRDSVSYVVYKSPARGIGIAVAVRPFFSACPLKSFQDLSTLDTGGVTYGCTAAKGQLLKVGAEVEAIAIKIGTVSPAPSGFSFLMGSQIYSRKAEHTLDGERRENFRASTIYSDSEEISPTPCQAESQTVVMKAHDVSQFRAIGSSTSPDSFALKINCPAFTDKVAYQFDTPGAVAVGGSGKGHLVLPLTNSSAKGVGVQVTADDGGALNDKPYELVNPKPDSSHAFSVKLRAAYIQTENTVTPGSVNAALRLTLTYP